MGNDSIDVGDETPTRKTGQPRLFGTSGLPEQRIDQQNPSRAVRSDICGAMAQQHGDSGRGNQSVPQELLHLVGCREKGGAQLRKDPAKR